MLRKKERAKKIIFWIIIGVMVLAFVLWGSGAYKESLKGRTSAGIIFGRKVPIEEFRKLRLACLNEALLRFGENYRQLLPYINLNNQAWTRLILLEHARKLNIKASDQEVFQAITANPLFFKDGKFNQDTYDRIVRYFFNSQPREFEEQTRDGLSIRKLYEQTTKDVTVNDEELLNAYKQEFETTSINYVRVEKNGFLSQVQITDDRMKSYFQKNLSQFKRPPAAKGDSHIPTFEEAKADVEQELKLDLSEEEARKKIENYKIKIDEYLKNNSTSDFKEAAKTLGAEVKTTPQFKRGASPADMQLDKEIQYAAFGLKPGQVSAILETSSAFYLIGQDKWTGIDEEKFRQEKETYRKNVLEEKKQNAFNGLAQGLISKSNLKDYSPSFPSSD